VHCRKHTYIHVIAKVLIPKWSKLIHGYIHTYIRQDSSFLGRFESALNVNLGRFQNNSRLNVGSEINVMLTFSSHCSQKHFAILSNNCPKLSIILPKNGPFCQKIIRRQHWLYVCINTRLFPHQKKIWLQLTWPIFKSKWMTKTKQWKQVAPKCVLCASLIFSLLTEVAIGREFASFWTSWSPSYDFDLQRQRFKNLQGI
jgi:hypothetical protein